MKQLLQLFLNYQGFLLLLPGLLLGHQARAQAPAWHSAMGVLSNTGNDQGANVNIVTDASGNVYLTGIFMGSITFGSTTLTSAGSSDVYVAKWSPITASFVWAQRAGGPGAEDARGIAVVGSNVYVAGSFNSPAVSFGPITITNNTGSGSSSDMFVAKLTDAGSAASFTWVQRVGGPGTDEAFNLAASGPNIYLTGYFESAQLPFGSTTLANAGGYDALLGKLVDQGSTCALAWVRQAGGPGTEEPYALAVSGSTVYWAGAFTSSTLALGGTTLPNAGSYDGFVAKVVDAGSTSSVAWAQRVGGPGPDDIASLAVSGSAVYIGGAFSGAMALGGGTLTSAGGRDVYVARLTDAGASASVAWAQQAGGLDNDFAYTLAVRGPELYVAGHFGAASAVPAPTATFGSTTLTSAGNSDIFLTRLTDLGTSASFAWAQRGGGNSADLAYTVALGGSSVYVGGSFLGSSAAFGAAFISNASGVEAGYMAILRDPVLAAATPAALAGLALYPNPARGAATVQLPAGAGVAQVSFTLTDALGRGVRAAAGVAVPAAGLLYDLPLAGLAPGVYLLRVQAGGAVAARRLVVE
ncbi:MAG: T9SS type A sorting domain-containing protein [Hymenobacter sp.]|nr:MAG: T9SS type A sorting domain-containing protein [Hymenobacter sp.]